MDGSHERDRLSQCDACQAVRRASAVPAYDRSAVTAGHRPSRRRRLPPRASGGLCRRLPCRRRDATGASSALRCAAPTRAMRSAPQDGLYTLAMRSGAGENCASSARSASLLVAPEDPAALLDAPGRSAHPHRHADGHRKGLSARRRRRSRRRRIPTSPGTSRIRTSPQTAHGFLAEALARRRAAGTTPFTVLCCDNLPANGATLRRLLLQFAELRDGDLGRLHRRRGRLPVDHGRPHRAGDDRRRPRARIRGARRRGCLAGDDRAVHAMGGRGQFPAGRPRWEELRRHHGERRAALRGDEAQAAQRRAFGDRLSRPAHSATRPCRPPSPIRRSAASSIGFGPKRSRPCRRMPASIRKPTRPRSPSASPIRRCVHRTAQIAKDGSQKLPQRISRTALARLEAGAPAAHLMLTVAAWIACCRGARPDRCRPAHFTDPLDARLARIFAGNREPRDTGRARSSTLPASPAAKRRAHCRRSRPVISTSFAKAAARAAIAAAAREGRKHEADLALVRAGRSRKALACAAGRRDRRRHARCTISMTAAPGRSTRSRSARPRSRPAGSTGRSSRASSCTRTSRPAPAASAS